MMTVDYQNHCWEAKQHFELISEAALLIFGSISKQWISFQTITITMDHQASEKKLIEVYEVELKLQKIRLWKCWDTM